jgi:hypothetical protein
LLWPAVFLSTDRPPELLAVLAHDRGGRIQANAGGTPLIYEGALCGDPPDDIPPVSISAAIAITSHGRYSAFSAHC